MSETIKWSIDVQAIGGPKLAPVGEMQLDAYDKIQVTVDVGDSDVKVDLQPAVKGQAELLAITANEFSDKVSYKVNDKASTRTVALDGPHVLIGKGAVSLLDSAPASLFFTNSMTDAVVIQILIGRDATPPTP